MSDGRTQSLDYLSERFRGSVSADTSKPTGVGNYYVREGMLRAFDIPLSRATVALVGIGNIGHHIFDRLASQGTKIIAIEAREERRAPVIAAGHRAVAPDEKMRIVCDPIDALVVNASGGSLDSHTVSACVANPQLRVICGSENLVMPNPADARRLADGKKSYCPTELGGMMGYLTAVEEYLANVERMPFDMATLFEAAKRLEPAAFEATRRQIERDFAITFEDAMREVTAC
jgi:glutamate dehydrogenase/leucine dehydrogenase